MSHLRELSREEQLCILEEARMNHAVDQGLEQRLKQRIERELEQGMERGMERVLAKGVSKGRAEQKKEMMDDSHVEKRFGYRSDLQNLRFIQTGNQRIERKPLIRTDFLYIRPQSP